MHFFPIYSKKNLLIFSSCLTLLTSCGQRDQASQKGVIAYVNQEPITVAELDQNIQLKEQTDPLFRQTRESKQEQLELIIDKKLIIQEAVEQGLIREDKFVNTIKTFWEQTLIREFISMKKKEFESQLVATEEEVSEYYAHLGKRVTFNVLRTQNKGEIDTVRNLLTKGQEVSATSWKTIGPVDYSDIDSLVLLDAFEWPVGAFKVIEQKPDYYLVMIAKKEIVPIRPLEEMKREIIREIISLKEKRLFDSWLRSKRENSTITILK